MEEYNKDRLFSETVLVPNFAERCGYLFLKSLKSCCSIYHLKTRKIFRPEYVSENVYKSSKIEYNVAIREPTFVAKKLRLSNLTFEVINIKYCNANFPGGHLVWSGGGCRPAPLFKGTVTSFSITIC